MGCDWDEAQDLKNMMIGDSPKACDAAASLSHCATPVGPHHIRKMHSLHILHIPPLFTLQILESVVCTASNDLIGYCMHQPQTRTCKTWFSPRICAHTASKGQSNNPALS